MADLLYQLGKRVERLLYFGALLGVMSTALFLFNNSAENARNRTLLASVDYVLSCMDDVLMDKLEEKYKSLPKNPKSWELHPYLSLVTGCVYDYAAPIGFFSNGLYRIIKDRIENIGLASPQDIKERLAQWRKEIAQQPTRFYDFEIPSSVALDVVGNRITSPVTAIVALIRLALGPVIFVWLTSLVSTRSNEIQLAGQTTYSAMLFPHILNSFPRLTDEPRLKRKAGRAPSIQNAVRTHAVIRCIVMLCVTAGTGGVYLAALYSSFEQNLEFPWGLMFGLILLGVPMISCVAQEGMLAARRIIFIERVYSSAPYRDS